MPRLNLPIPSCTSTGTVLKAWISGVIVDNGQMVAGTSTPTYVTITL